MDHTGCHVAWPLFEHRLQGADKGWGVCACTCGCIHMCVGVQMLQHIMHTITSQVCLEGRRLRGEEGEWRREGDKKAKGRGGGVEKGRREEG